jgi:hypothetical protein
MKNLLVTLTLCFGMILVGQAQRSEREIYTALAYGDDVFEPDLWYASATEEETRTQASWTSYDLSAVAFLDYLHFPDGIAPEELGEFFDKDWFNGTLANYEAWEQQAVCRAGELTLYEFEVDSEGSLYRMRYWIQPVSRERVAALFLVFPVDDPASMDDYATRLFPELVSCE